LNHITKGWRKTIWVNPQAALLLAQELLSFMVELATMGNFHQKPHAIGPVQQHMVPFTEGSVMSILPAGEDSSSRRLGRKEISITK